MLGLLQLVPFVWRLVAIGTLVAGLAGFAAYEHHRLVVEGEQVELKRIEDANAAERKKAEEGSQEVDDCFAIAGIWDRDLGVCDHPSR